MAGWLEDLLGSGNSAPHPLMSEILRRQAEKRPKVYGADELNPMDAAAAGNAVAFPMMPGILNGQPPQVSAPSPQMPPSVNDPQAGEPELYKNGVPLRQPSRGNGPKVYGANEYSPLDAAADRPRVYGANEFTPLDAAAGQSPLSMAPGAPQANPAAMPQGATPAIGGPMPLPGGPVNQSPPGSPSGGIGDILGKILSPENAPLLMAMGAGFAGAPSFGQGMQRALAGAGPQLATIQNKNQTVKALVARGLPQDVAQAAASNPEILKQVIPQAFGAKQRKFTQIGEGPFGDKQYGFVDETSGKTYGLDGKELGTGGAGPAGAPGGAALLAPGVKEYNPQLFGEEYFNQFSPEIQAGVKAYIRGDTQPTGNPRLKGFDTVVKQVARKYGDDVGVPISDALFSERRKYRTELGSNSPNTAGGQAKAFNQGIEHASALADKLVKLGNYDPLGIPMVAHGINAAREGLSTDQKGLANEARAIGQTLAGEVGKLFSGSAGGGVHERELTRQRFDTVGSGKELAGALAGTIDTMEGGLKALEQRRDQTLGANSDVNFVTKETEAKIAHIKDVIAQLRGDKRASTAVAPANAGGKPQSVIQNGHTYVLQPDGSYK